MVMMARRVARAHVFAKAWLCLALLLQVPKDLQRLAHTIAIAATQVQCMPTPIFIRWFVEMIKHVRVEIIIILIMMVFFINSCCQWVWDWRVIWLVAIVDAHGLTRAGHHASVIVVVVKAAGSVRVVVMMVIVVVVIVTAAAAVAVQLGVAVQHFAVRIDHAVRVLVIGAVVRVIVAAVHMMIVVIIVVMVVLMIVFVVIVVVIHHAVTVVIIFVIADPAFAVQWQPVGGVHRALFQSPLFRGGHRLNKVAMRR